MYSIQKVLVYEKQTVGKRMYPVNIFLFSPQKHMPEALLMSIHNICFCGEIRKISIHCTFL